MVRYCQKVNQDVLYLQELSKYAVLDILFAWVTVFSLQGDGDEYY
jgi:hypothetical protein